MSGFRANLSGTTPATGARFSGLGDWVTDWSFPAGSGLWIASLEWSATGTPVGELYLEINASGELPTPDPDQTIRLVLPSGTPGCHGAWPTVGGIVRAAAVFVKSPAPAMRVGYVHGSGGAPNQFRVRITQRA